MSKLALGTVQFGLDYGVSNQTGQTPQQEVNEILTYAAEQKLTMLDTSVNYGESEQVIGNSGLANQFRIVSKTPVFSRTLTIHEQLHEIQSSLNASIAKLKVDSLYGLLTHDPDALVGPSGEYIYQCLVDLKQSGLVNKVGASIYTLEQAHYLIDNYETDIVQLPMNILDQSFLKSGLLKKMKQHGIEIHVRSAFLQGLLLMELDTLPPYFSPIRTILNNLKEENTSRHLSQLAASYGFVNSIDEVDHIVCGVNNASQLNELVHIANTKLDTKAYSSFHLGDPQFTNPANWSL